MEVGPRGYKEEHKKIHRDNLRRTEWRKETLYSDPENTEMKS